MRLLALLLSALAPVATSAPGTVGFQQLSVPDAAGRPISVFVWYPSNDPATVQQLGGFTQTVSVNGHVLGGVLPLVLISHGTGGGSGSHFDTAVALAQAGFVVAAPTHTGDNYQDQSYAGNRKDLTDRPRQVKLVLDYMLTVWADHNRVDPSRVGMFGFSLGGFTTLVEAGGTPDLSRMLELCTKRPGAPECIFVKQRKGDQLDTVTTKPAWIHDERVKAAVVAAPAASYLFGPGSLKDVTIPIQLWRASNDEQVPDEWNTALVRSELRRPAEEHLVASAGHFVFLPPCSEALAKQAPQICTDSAGFDRAAFHRTFNVAVVEFFTRHLTR
jgi:predicted dienelactone hydrolase